MTHQPYERFSEKEMILREHLAADRSVLANERTMLAYVRTALAFVVSGVGLVKFFDELATDILGWFFFACGIVTTVIGAIRYRAVSRSYHSLKQGAKSFAHDSDHENE